MKKWKQSFLGLICLIIFVFNTLILGGLIYLLLPLKLLAPSKQMKNRISLAMVGLAEFWIQINTWFLDAVHRPEWDISPLDQLDISKSYLVSANHRSWVDIPVLQKVFNRRIPFLRFFLKQQLIYVPILGGVWWALDFPFLKRYSPQYLSRHPHKRGEDFKTIRRTCERFKDFPISILNFLEGTRFTTAKHQAQNSPYPHLLNPKIGGIAFVLDAMGEQFDCLLDVTIFYPTGNPTLWSLLSGQLQRIVVRVQSWSIPEELTQGRCFKDEQNRRKTHEWVKHIWEQKEHQLATLSLQTTPS